MLVTFSAALYIIVWKNLKVIDASGLTFESFRESVAVQFHVARHVGRGKEFAAHPAWYFSLVASGVCFQALLRSKPETARLKQVEKQTNVMQNRQVELFRVMPLSKHSDLWTQMAFFILF